MARVAHSIVLFASAVSTLPALAQNSPLQQSESEEPDFAFISGSGYTQVKESIQFIHQTAYGTRRFALPGGRRNKDEFLFFFRTEWGFTDRLELDVVAPVTGSRERLNGRTLSSDYGISDSILGLRYRLLKEVNAPFTLTTGPQLILPSGRVRRGTGLGSAGFAWDVAASKDWRGPAFLYSTFNYRVLPSADDTTPGSARQFTLHGLAWATALGLRALERPRSGSKHDVHIFLEAGGAWEQEIVPGVDVGTRQGKLSWVVSPGVRYGFFTARKTLTEIGVAAPIGLGANGPKKGFVVQFQFENVFGQK